jgi:hypothetical protein
MKKIVLSWGIAVMLILAACQLLPPEDSYYADELAIEPTVSGEFIQRTVISTRQPETVSTPTQEELMESEGKEKTPVSVSIGELSQPETEDLSAAPRPDVIWEKDSEVRIVSGTQCCGYTSPLVPLNYIPDVQIWGDGHMIWVENFSDGSRIVWETWLSQKEMQAALQSVVDTGFYGMQDSYKNPLVADIPEKCLSVNLVDHKKQVCGYYQGAPQEFHDLYAYFADGIGLDGEAYVPKIGYLTSYPFPVETSLNQEDVDYVWDTQSLGLSLSEAVDQGIWIDGASLEFAWEIVNANQGSMVVQDGDLYYQISLQIPTVSWQEPPVP